MIELHADPAAESKATLVLRPNRSLSARQLRSFFYLLATVAGGTAAFGWLQGNAFAPLFAVLHLGFVALCLALVWRRSGCSEVIALNRDLIEVWRGPQGETVFSAHPLWVRVTVSPDGRLWLESRGRRTEIGAFLGEGERSRLAAQVRELLAGLK